MKHIPLNVVLLAAVLWPALSLSQSLVICTADMPTVSADGAVTVRVRAISRGPLKCDWNATGGSIRGTGTEEQWNFAGVAPGIYRVTVRVRGPDINETCTLRMVVTQPDRGHSPTETGKGFLENG